MKMTDEHFDMLSEAIDQRLATIKEQGGDSLPIIASHYREQGMTPRRFRWDVLYACGVTLGEHPSTNNTRTHIPLYAYLNDDHIDTALRLYMKKASIAWAAS